MLCLVSDINTSYQPTEHNALKSPYKISLKVAQILDSLFMWWWQKLIMICMKLYFVIKFFSAKCTSSDWERITGHPEISEGKVHTPTKRWLELRQSLRLCDWMAPKSTKFTTYRQHNIQHFVNWCTIQGHREPSTIYRVSRVYPI